jgi:hypothetical protein
MAHDSSEQEPAPKEAPHTHRDAVVLRRTSVANARVVYIERARYRLAEFGGRFLLAENPLCYHLDTPQLKVVMTWFDWAPEDGVCRVTPLSHVTFSVGSYDDIVANVGVENWQFRS